MKKLNIFLGIRIYGLVRGLLEFTDDGCLDEPTFDGEKILLPSIKTYVLCIIALILSLAGWSFKKIRLQKIEDITYAIIDGMEDPFDNSLFEHRFSAKEEYIDRLYVFRVQKMMGRFTRLVSNILDNEVKKIEESQEKLNRAKRQYLCARLGGLI